MSVWGGCVSLKWCVFVRWVCQSNVVKEEVCLCGVGVSV